MTMLYFSFWLFWGAKEIFWVRVSFHIKQHGQPGINVLESKTVGWGHRIDSSCFKSSYKDYRGKSSRYAWCSWLIERVVKYLKCFLLIVRWLYINFSKHSSPYAKFKSLSAQHSTLSSFKTPKSCKESFSVTLLRPPLFVITFDDVSS